VGPQLPLCISGDVFTSRVASKMSRFDRTRPEYISGDPSCHAIPCATRLVAPHTFHPPQASRFSPQSPRIHLRRPLMSCSSLRNTLGRPTHFSLFTFHFSLFTFHFSLFTFHFSLFTSPLTPAHSADTHPTPSATPHTPHLLSHWPPALRASDTTGYHSLGLPLQSWLVPSPLRDYRDVL